MRGLSAGELLAVWERGQGLPPEDQALLLLAAASSTSLDALAALSIGQRDAWLLTLREWTFGAWLACVATCARCRERLELEFSAADLRLPGAAGPHDQHQLALDGYAITFRLPDSRDLAALRDPASGQQTLLARCLLDIRRGDQAVSLAALPPAVLAEVVAQMGRADPQADVQLDLACPSCGHRWLAPFDIVVFFWREIEVWAGRTLRDVHTLASAYGWHEADILALTPQRRQIYLELVRG